MILLHQSKQILIHTIQASDVGFKIAYEISFVDDTNIAESFFNYHSSVVTSNASETPMHRVQYLLMMTFLLIYQTITSLVMLPFVLSLTHFRENGEAGWGLH